MNALVRDLVGTPWRTITLSVKHDVWCLVDAVDYDWLSATIWNVSWGGRTPWQLYAKRNIGAERATVRMHREIMMKAEPIDRLKSLKMHVDHVNGQTLDNRRSNLRWATPQENRANHRERHQIPSLESIVADLLRGCAPAVLEDIPF